MSYPLTDCTNAIIQAENCVGRGGPCKPARRVVTHNPYASVLPASYASCDGGVLTSGCDADWCAYAAQQPCVTPPSASSLPGLSTPGSPGSVRRSLFGGAPSTAAAPLSRDTSLAQESPTASAPATPLRAVGKVYVGGRPMPVRRRLYAEVTVRTRQDEAAYQVADVAALVGDAAAEQLLQRHVLVDGDRGQDLGCVVAVRCEELRALDAADDSALPRVLRAATAEDLRQLEQLCADEEEALAYARDSVAEAGLDGTIRIEDATFQFDRNKLTLQYTSDTYVDFNRLTRLMHNRYRCRIWMDQLNRAPRKAQTQTQHDRRDNRRGRAAASKRK